MIQSFRGALLVSASSFRRMYLLGKSSRHSRQNLQLAIPVYVSEINIATMLTNCRSKRLG